MARSLPCLLLLAALVAACGSGAGGSPSQAPGTVASLQPSAAAQPTPTPTRSPQFVAISAHMSSPRQWATATALRDGRVLIAGGYGCESELASACSSAEIYDPVSQTFTSTGSMSVGRFGHAAVLLMNGQVLVVGGGIPKGGEWTAELYDPTSGTWKVTGAPIHQIDFSFTATLLKDGRVLIVGADSMVQVPPKAPGAMAGEYAVPAARAELYDPATGKFTETGALVTPRFGHAAALLPDGHVLVTGGSKFTRFDTDTDKPHFTPIASAEEFDPATGKFTTVGSMTTPRDEPVAASLPGGKVLIAGGCATERPSNVICPSVLLTSAETYDTSTRSFSPAGAMRQARDSQAVATLHDGRVLLAGGRWIGTDIYSQNGLYSGADVFDPIAGGFTSLAAYMVQARADAAVAVLEDGSVLIAGGEVTFQGPASDTAELFVP
jgi:hypothetical protein